jgi:hypothetical protein
VIPNLVTVRRLRPPRDSDFGIATAGTAEQDFADAPAGLPIGLRDEVTQEMSGERAGTNYLCLEVTFLSPICRMALGSAALAAQGSPNGAATQRPVFYEGDQVTVNMFEVPAVEGSLLESNRSINTIYASNDLDDEQDFLSVIDAIQGEEFNPLWHQVLIVFNEGFTPHQFVSEDQVLAAAAVAHPEITLVSTDEVYRCSIVGSK